MASLVDNLIKEKKITVEQLDDAKDKQLGAKKPIQELLVDMGFITDEDLVQFTSKLYKVPVTSLDNEKFDTESLDKLSYDLANRYGVFPVRIESGTMILAMSDPQDLIVIDELRSLLDINIKPVLCSTRQIQDYIKQRYQSTDAMYDLMNNVVEEAGEPEEQIDVDPQEQAAADQNTHEIKIELSDGQKVNIQDAEQDSSPTVKLVNLILADAIKVRASDIHLEPREDCLEVRYRVDGDLKNIMRVPKNVQAKMIARIKIMSDMDIAQDVKPQDGRINLIVSSRKVDFRISTIPTYYGEKIVARILDAKEAKTDMDKIGFAENERQIFTNAVKQPQGMVLVTGPTGSGKTSTLYAALNFLKNETTNIVTIEDPVEFVNEGINQIQVNPGRGVTFASGLRSILRQDPNVILVGEIRDQETAEIALKASITGHLVLSTLHTNSTIATISRLVDIGIDNYMVGSAVILIVSQRLVKVICPNCRNAFEPDNAFIQEYKSYIDEYKIEKFFKGDGCQKCNYTGYFGRTAVFEVLQITQRLSDLIGSKATDEVLRKEAKAEGLKTLVDAGIEKASQGITTLEEVAKNLGDVKETTDMPAMPVQPKKPEPVQPTVQEQAPPVKAPEPEMEVVQTPESVTPKQEAPQKPAKPAETPATQQTNTVPRVLIAEDERDIQKIIAKLLETEGYEVIVANDGKDAIIKTVKEKPDLIIMDINMPVMDGMQATRHLRSSLETAVIPIMMLTASKDSELRGLKAGANDYMVKPFDKNKLKSRIKLLLEQDSLKEHRFES